MKRRTAFILTAIALLLIVLGSLSLGTISRPRTVHAQATDPSELPADTKTLEFDKPLTETLDSTTPSRLYKFQAKANQLIRLSVEPKTQNFFTTISILTLDLQTTLGGTLGETLVAGSIIVKIPDDGTYVVSIDYADSTTGTPMPGSYQITLSEFKPS
jgi:hypothetical protein